MKKSLKILASILLILVITLVAIPYFYKDEIVDFIKKDINNLLNATVDFKDVDVSIFKDFPNFHMQLNQFTIDGKAPFQNVQLMNVENIGLSFNIKSVLFEDKIEIEKFSISKGVIDLQVLKNGKANYDIIKKDTVSESKEATSFDIQLKEYEIIDTNLSYTDNSIGFKTQLEKINHQGSGNFNADLYQLSTESTVDNLSLIYDGVQYLNNVVAKIDTDFDINGDFDTYILKNTHILINELPIAADGKFELKNDEVSIDLTYKTEDASLVKLLSLVPKNYMPDLNGVRSTGIVKLEGIVKGKSTSSIIPGFSVDINIKNATLQYPDLPEKVKNINTITSIRFKEGSNLDRMIINLPKIQFDIADNTARGNLKITQPLSDPFINTNFKSNLDFNTISNAIKFKDIKELKGLLDADFSLKGKLSAIEKQDYEKFEASGFFKLEQFEYKSDSLDYEIKIPKATFDIKPEALQIQDFEANIGESDFNLKGSISNYIAYILGKDEVLTADLSSHSNYINMNNFMDTTESTDTSETELIRIPKNINISLVSSADKVTYKDMEMNDVKANLNMKDEKAKLSAVFMKSMGGNIQMDGLYDTSGEVAKTDVSFSMDKMPIKESAIAFSAFQAYAPVLQQITGQFFSNMNFSVDFDNQMNPVLNTVNAKGTFKTNEIYPEGIAVLKKIASITKIKELTNAKIDQFNTSFKIKNGGISILPVAFKLNDMQASFQGDFNLDQKLNLALFLDVPREKLGASINQVLESFIGGLDFLKLNTNVGELIKMKFVITGTASNPKIKPIVLGSEGETLVETVTEIVEDKIDEVRNEALLKAQAEADKLMAIAIEQKEKLVIEAQKMADKVRNQAVIASEKVIKEAGDDPMKLMAAKLSTNALKNEADKQAKKLIKTAEKQGDDLIEKAKIQSDNLLLEASQVGVKDSIE
jgi:hypothetical protein